MLINLVQFSCPSIVKIPSWPCHSSKWWSLHRPRADTGSENLDCGILTEILTSRTMHYMTPWPKQCWTSELRWILTFTIMSSTQWLNDTRLSIDAEDVTVPHSSRSAHDRIFDPNHQQLAHWQSERHWEIFLRCSSTSLLHSRDLANHEFSKYRTYRLVIFVTRFILLSD